MRWSKKAVLYVAAMALLAGAFVWSQAHTTTRPGDDFSTQVGFFGEKTTTVMEGNGWIAEYYLQGDCLRFRVGDMATMCNTMSYQPGDFATGLTEGRGHRIVWVITADTDPITVRWWSGEAERLQYVSVPVSDKGQLVAFELGPDEEPWGLQVLAADGAVVAVQPFSG